VYPPTDPAGTPPAASFNLGYFVESVERIRESTGDACE
jgi:hypothetical protein